MQKMIVTDRDTASHNRPLGEFLEYDEKNIEWDSEMIHEDTYFDRCLKSYESSLGKRKREVKRRMSSKYKCKTHLDWPGGIDLWSGSVLLLEVSGSILSSANLGGLV
jgi:hypothetical protein